MSLKEEPINIDELAEKGLLKEICFDCENYLILKKKFIIKGRINLYDELLNIVDEEDKLILEKIFGKIDIGKIKK